MALIVKCDDTEQQVQVPQEPDAQLAYLQGIVGGSIEYVPVCNDKVAAQGYTFLFCDEEGKLKGKPVNMRATVMAGRVEIGDPIVGDAIFCKQDEVQ